MRPQDALSSKFTIDRIVYTSPDNSFSIARGEWTEDETNRFAMRWNGDVNNPNDLGHPSAFGHPMWFQLPLDIREILAALIQNSEAMTI